MNDFCHKRSLQKYSFDLLLEKHVVISADGYPASQRASQNFCLLTYLHMYQVMEVFKWTPTVCDKNLLLGYRATKLPEEGGLGSNKD